LFLQSGELCGRRKKGCLCSWNSSQPKKFNILFSNSGRKDAVEDNSYKKRCLILSEWKGVAMPRKILVPWLLSEAGRKVFLDSGIEVSYLHGPSGEFPTLEELIEGVKKSDVLIARANLSVTRQVMRANPGLLGVANHGVGFNNIDLSAATELGIPVTNTPEVLTDSTADLTWALLMATARKIPQAHTFTTSGQWKGPIGDSFMGLDVGPGGSKKPKVLGIIGFGRIGKAVMQRSQGFKMKILAYDPFMKERINKTRGVEYRKLLDVLRGSDFITMHCPLTDETYHLIGEKEFNQMKPTAIFINTSRGPVVDEEALVQALRMGKIAGAGLDVYENEPILTPGLCGLENVVLLPHIGSMTKDTRDQMAILAVRNAIAMAKGKKPQNIVNPEVFKSTEYLRKLRTY
jgi:glyoxylate reductase